MTETGEVYVLDNNAFILRSILPRVELDSNVWCIARELVKTLRLQETAIVLRLANDHGTVNSDAVGAIDVDGHFVIRENTTDHCDIVRTVKKDSIRITISLHSSESGFFVGVIARRIRTQPNL